jgi:hypothetical protein
MKILRNTLKRHFEEKKRFNRVLDQNFDDLNPPDRNWIFTAGLVLLIAYGACLLAIAFALDSQASKFDKKLEQLEQLEQQEFYKIIKSNYKI